MTVPLNKQVHYSKRIYYVIFGQVVVKKCSGKKSFYINLSKTSIC